MKEQPVLQQLLTVFPFLQAIPKKQYFSLGTKELHLPSKKIFSIASELAGKLDQHVMTYNAHVFDTTLAPEHHLCGTLLMATLSKEQQTLLNEYEERTKRYGVSLVIYHKPVSVVDVSQTAVYRYYEKRLHLL